MLFLLPFPFVCPADSLSVRILNRYSHRETNRISFGSLPNSTGYTLPGEYLAVFYTNTEVSDWIIQVSTYNQGSTCPDGRHGGLIGLAHTGVRQPLLWQVFTNTNSQVACTNSSGWGRIKDKRDTDWEMMRQERFAVSNSFLAPYPKTGVPARSPFFLYLGGFFTNKTPDEYATTLFLEMFSLSGYTVPPGIRIQAPSEINLIGDKIVIYADVSDSDIIDTVNFYYKKKTDISFSLITESPSSPVYRFRAEIPPEQTGIEGLEYFMDALDEKVNKTNTRTNSILVIPEVTRSIGFSGGEIVLQDGNPEDGEVSFSLVSGCLEGSKSITLKQIWKAGDIPPGNGDVAGRMPLMAFELSPDLALSRLCRFDLLYLDLDNDGLVELVDGTETSAHERDLAVFWWDRFDWRYLGGIADAVNNTVSVYIRHMGLFGLFPATGLTRESFRPKERIITPNGDGINDAVYFGGMPGSVTIEIFNAAGRLIRRISDICEWDGKDDRGKRAESGVYIYQARFRLNGKEEMISGSMAIAR